MENKLNNYKSVSIVTTLFNEEGIIALLPYDKKEGSNISLVWSLNIQKSEEVLSLDKKSIEEKLYKDTEGTIGHLQLNSELRSFPLYQMHALDYFCIHQRNVQHQKEILFYF